jgi:hypothetical protein
MVSGGRTELRRAVWKAMLDAHLNCKYWPSLAERYGRREFYAKVFLAAVSSSAVASWGLWIQVDGLWKTLSALAALIAVILPIANVPRKLQVMSEIAGNWRVLLAEYEALWLNYNMGAKNDREVLDELNRLRRREAEEDRDTAELPLRTKLRRDSFAEVLRVRGLPKTQPTKEA